MSESLKERQRAEILALQKQGLTRAEDLVEFARNPATAIHCRFTWDDSEAAHQFRLIEARTLLVSVRITDDRCGEIQAFVSLRQDRTQPGGGYRQLVSVLSDDELYKQAVQDALKDHQYWENKYRHLRELGPITRAAKRVRQRLDKSPKKSRPNLKVAARKTA